MNEVVKPAVLTPEQLSVVNSGEWFAALEPAFQRGRIGIVTYQRVCRPLNPKMVKIIPVALASACPYKAGLGKAPSLLCRRRYGRRAMADPEYRLDSATP
jgi:hypothetical protein